MFFSSNNGHAHSFANRTLLTICGLIHRCKFVDGVFNVRRHIDRPIT